MPPPADDLRRRLTSICTALPEVTAEPAGRHVVYRVRTRTFAYFQDDHHGDGRVTLVCKVEPGEDAALVDAEDGHFCRPAYCRRGWVGYRLDVAPVAWDEVEELVIDSYRRVAPKRLARLASPADASE